MIRRIVSVVAVGGLAVLAFWMPREAPIAADSVGDLPVSVVFRAHRGNATPPFIGRWDLTFSEASPAEQRLTLQIGTPTGATAPGRLTAAPGEATALVARMTEVLSDRPPVEELPPVSELDLRLDLLAERAAVGQGDVGATVIAGAFVADPAGDWRVYRVTLGANGPR